MPLEEGGSKCFTSRQSQFAGRRDTPRPWPVLLGPQRSSYRQEDTLQLSPSTPPRRELLGSSQLPPSFHSIASESLCSSLKEYSDFLKEPTLDNAAKACSLLDSPEFGSDRRADSPRSSHRSSSPKTGRSSSPSYWALDNSRSSHISDVESVAAFEEWEGLTSPFFLLASAEVLAANLEHVVINSLDGRVSPFASLAGLYHLVQMQLKKTKESLCEPMAGTSALLLPFVPENRNRTPSTTDEDGASTDKNAGRQTAISIAAAIDALHNMISTRCQLIELQSLLFRRGHVNPAKSFQELMQAATTSAVLLESFLATKPADAETQYGPVEGMISNLVRELKAWKFCFETCASLDRCDFAHTLLSLRKWKAHLPKKHVDNRVTHWMHWSIAQVSALLPVYFDRVRAFASPVYGFDVSKLWHRRVAQPADERTTNWNAVVLDFLRRHAKGSGTYEMAVALVLDAVSTGASSIERGYQIGRIEDKTNDFSNEKGIVADSKQTLNGWPAVYLRSSLRLGNTSVAQPSPRSSSVWSSQSSLRRPGSSAGPAPNAPKRKQSLLGASPSIGNVKTWNLGNQTSLEYAPDVGASRTFPHTKWELLGDLLDSKSPRHGQTRHRFEQVEVRSHYFEQEVANSLEPQQNNAPSIFSFHWPDSRQDGVGTVTLRRRQQYSYHVVPVGEWLRLVVIVEGRLDEPKRHERRNNDNSEDVRSFLRGVAKGLSARGLICKDAISVFKPSSKLGPLNLPTKDLSSPENEVQSQFYLNEFKGKFGLRPSSPFLNERSLYSPRRLSHYSPSMKRFQRPSRFPDMDQSATVLFLGVELASLVD